MILYVNGQDIAQLVLALEKDGELYWAHHDVAPEQFLKSIIHFLGGHSISLETIDMFFVVVGPGSATALRSVLSIINTVSFVQKTPIIPFEKPLDLADEKAFKNAMETLKLAEKVEFARPVYSHAPKISRSKKDQLRRKIG